MIGWYIGEFIFFVVTVAVVVPLLQRFLNPVLAIKATADDILEHALEVNRQLEAVPKLVQTRELTGAAYQLVGRYGAAIVAILAG
ncbi:MAG: hypothetical protein ACRDX8_04845 [Acidimicrobiales bacterium]